MRMNNKKTGQNPRSSAGGRQKKCVPMKKLETGRGNQESFSDKSNGSPRTTVATRTNLADTVPISANFVIICPDF